MKIAYISSAFLADCDMPLIREIIKQGHEVYYYVQMSDSSRQATIINVERLQPKGGVHGAECYKGLAHLSAYLPLDHVKVINMPSPHDWAPSSVKAVWTAWRQIENGGFDVVHLTSPLRYGAFLLYMLRKKMVLTMHDPLPHSSDLGRMNRFHRFVAFRLVNHFIVLSESLREEFVQTYNLQKKHVYVSRLGVYDVLLQATPAEMQLPEKYILFVGSINPHKGIRYLCEAFEQIHEEHNDVHFVIAGRGCFDFDIEHFTSSLPVTVINRFVTDGELVTLLGNSLFTVCPYIDATQSGVIMSAFALGKPVLATRVGALGEMMEDGRHGLLVSPRDSNALAAAINDMLSDEVLGEMQRNINLDYTSGQRSWNDIAKQHINIYKAVNK